MDPGKFPDGTWNIPESGNGVPDILDEAKWELDWILKMQQSDGGVYHKLTSQSWFQGMPQADIGPRYFFERTTHETASAAAVRLRLKALETVRSKIGQGISPGSDKGLGFPKTTSSPGSDQWFS